MSGWHTDFFPYVMDTHVTDDYPEWGSAPRGPLLDAEMAHRGELMASVIGESVTTPGKQVVYHVLRCELCIACHIWPLPDEAALAAYYQRRFYAGPASQEVAQHKRDRLWHEQCNYGPVLAQCEQLLHDYGMPYNKSLLDIGAGTGVLLDTAKQRGLCTMGVEPDLRQCAALFSRGHLVGGGTLRENHAAIRMFRPDICTLWETLEHVSCPEETLIDIYDMMRPGALLVVSVPNDGSPYQMAVCQKYGIAPYWYIPPIHTFYWTPKTLQLCIRRCGFQILDMRGTYPLEREMLKEGGQCYVGNHAAWRAYTDGKNAYELAAVQDHAWHKLEAMYRSNLQQRIGRSIICIARKD